MTSIHQSVPVPTQESPPRSATEVGTTKRLLMVLIGYIPFLNVLVMGTLVVAAERRFLPGYGWTLAVAWLLLIPPLVVRFTLTARPLPRADIPLGSRDFLLWWFTAQWQMIFNRLPWIEEMIRLVPGLYAVWLRLWGARVGKLVYWTPGLRILDRSYVSIGDRVIFGADVRINPHIIMPDEHGKLVLRLATVTIGNDAMVGGASILLAGSWVAAGEVSMAKRELKPFTGWEHGKRVVSDRSR